MKKTLLSLSLLLSFSAFAQNQPTLKQGQEICATHNEAGAPTLNYGQENNVRLDNRTINLCRLGYFGLYDPITRAPIWTAENLSADKILDSNPASRSNPLPDPHLPSNIPQATLQDYQATGFAPVLMAPAQDMNAPGNQKDEHVIQSLYLTNVSPMVASNLANGIWGDLENQVREWTRSRKNLLVVTGSLYDNAANPVVIGNNVWVPTRFYKVILDPVAGKSIAFVIPNVQIITRKSGSTENGNSKYVQTTSNFAYNCGNVCSLVNFRTSVAEVAKIAHLNFFPEAKNANLTKIDAMAWPINQ